MPDISRVAVCSTSDNLLPTARDIADRLQLPCFQTPRQPRQPASPDIDLLLVVTPHSRFGHQLELRPNTDFKTKLVIDFTTGKTAYRIKHGGGRNQALARAVGLNKYPSPRVIDATAGLGRDAFVLAGLGCRLRLIERSAVAAALLQDALRRAALSRETDEKTDTTVFDRMQLFVGDARELIPQLCAREPADVIYLDPMYPPRNKSALVKKDMQMLQTLLGKDYDTGQLLTVALQHAGKRVVVKRPKSAAVVPGPSPAHTVQTKTTRFDVYMV